MSPSAYIALARDVCILLALAFVVWRIYAAGQNAVKAADLQFLQAQLSEQAKTLDSWRQEATNANDQLSRDVATLHAPTPNKPPVWLCNAPSSPRRPVLPATAPTAPSEHPSPGGADIGSQRDIRPQLDAFQLKYETALAECRSVYSQWPQVTR